MPFSDVILYDKELQNIDPLSFDPDLYYQSGYLGTTNPSFTPA